MKYWLKAIAASCFIASFSVSSDAQTAGGPVTIASVFSGNSSVEADAIGFAVSGNPLNSPAACYSSSNNLTFYYITSAAIGKDHALSVLLTAKATGRPVYIAYSAASANTMYFYSSATTCAVGALWVVGS